MTKKQMCRAYYAAKCKVTALHISFHLQYFIIFPILQTIKSEGMRGGTAVKMRTPTCFHYPCIFLSLQASLSGKHLLDLISKGTL